MAKRDTQTPPAATMPPHPGREPVPESFATSEDYIAAYKAWRERWEPWIKARAERGEI